MKFNSISIIDTLHELYSLTYNQIGRFHVANTIRLEGNLQILLNLIEKCKQSTSSTTSADSKITNPIIGYAIDLIELTIKTCIQIDYLDDHLLSLLELVKNHDIYESTISIQLQEIGIYLKPLELPNAFGYDNITPLCEMLKRSIEFITTFPGDLIMALRLIYHLAIPLLNSDNASEYVELKHKFVVLQFYSNDGIATLLSILEKIINHFEQPEMHVAALASNQGILATQIILPTVELLRKMLTYVIQSRNTQFKDLTAIEHLMKTYILMHHIVEKSPAYADANQIQNLIIQTLLSYTQPSPIEGVDTESVHKSLWAQMLGELMKHILTAPRTFLTGLTLLSELLPLPLPVYVTDELSEAEQIRIKTERQLWSAHLHAKSALLTELIQTMCTSNVTQLNSTLCSFCIQLADLAPNMALVVVKSIIELMLNDTGSQSSVTQQTIQLLRFTSVLAHNPQIKVAIISILPGKLVDYLCGILVANTSVLHGSAQELVLDIFITLLDPNIRIGHGKTEISFTSALPSKDILPLMISGVLEVFTLAESTIKCRQLAIKTLEKFSAVK